MPWCENSVNSLNTVITQYTLHYGQYKSEHNIINVYLLCLAILYSYSPLHPPRNRLPGRYIRVTLCHLVGTVYKTVSQAKHQQMAGTSYFTNCYIDQLSCHLTTIIKTEFFIKQYEAGPGGRAVYGVDLWPLACWDCGFESHWGHGCLSVVNVVRSQV